MLYVANQLPATNSPFFTSWGGILTLALLPLAFYAVSGQVKRTQTKTDDRATAAAKQLNDRLSKQDATLEEQSKALIASNQALAVLVANIEPLKSTTEDSYRRINSLLEATAGLTEAIKQLSARLDRVQHNAEETGRTVERQQAERDTERRNRR